MNCGNCGSYVKRWTFLWANQYGNKKRYFCHNCGQWTDIKHEYNSNKVYEEIRKRGVIIADF